MLIAVNFHYVRPDFEQPYPSFFGVTPAEFEQRLDRLGSLGAFVGAADIRSALRGERPLPERAWAVTFDDGLREQFDHGWSILERKGIPGIFFVNTRPIAEGRVSSVHKIHLLRSTIAPDRLLSTLGAVAGELGIALPEVDGALATRQYHYDTVEVARLKYLLNIGLRPEETDRIIGVCFERLMPAAESEIARDLYMDREQVATLAARDCLGTHAHEHLPLGRLDDEAIEHQIRASVDLLESWTGSRPYALSYPFGGVEACTSAAGRVARETGVEFAFTMERAGNEDLREPLFLARCDNNDLPGGKAARYRDETVFSEIPAARWHRPWAREGAA